MLGVWLGLPRWIPSVADADRLHVVLPETAPLAAEIVVLPTAAELARPCEPAALLIVATLVLLDAQVTCVVSVCVELSV